MKQTLSLIAALVVLPIIAMAYIVALCASLLGWGYNLCHRDKP